MRKYWLFLQGAFFSFLINTSWAATSATAVVTFTIAAIDSISVSGNPAPLVVDTAVAGSPPTSATDNSTTYAVTTNGTGRKVQGSIDAAMPTGVTLTVSLVAPTGATSAGPVALTTSPQDLVTGISNVAESGLTITYTLSATIAAAPVTGATRTVTYTIGP